MLRTCQPIEDRRSDRFRPAHCPLEDCPDHLRRAGYRATKQGGFRRACDGRRVPRFRCPTCHRGFSQSTFATTYRLKRPELLAPVASLLVAGSAHRQIARHLGCAHATVTRLSVRLGRHAGLLQRLAARELGSIDEPVVFDHFETFVRSQRERVGIGTAVGRDSWYVHAIGGARYLAAFRRGGRRRALRRAPRPAAPRAIARSTEKLLRSLARRAPRGLELISDDHPAYPGAVKRINACRTGRPAIRHITYPNPDRGPGHDRVAARARDRAMFPVDLLHKLIRHCQAHHRRETIAFGRRTDSTIGRVELLAVWRNFVKRRSERRPERVTPAMVLGLTDRVWSWRDVLAERLFERRLAGVGA